MDGMKPCCAEKLILSVVETGAPAPITGPPAGSHASESKFGLD
jgi:hypothetical protein